MGPQDGGSPNSTITDATAATEDVALSSVGVKGVGRETQGNGEKSNGVSPPENLNPEIQTRLAQADRLKDEGNVHFKKSEFKAALQKYSEAIEECEKLPEGTECPNLHVYYSNRAFCDIHLENFGSAIIDADQAVALKPTYSKAYYRRGSAKLCLFKYKEALADFRTACKLSNDSNAAAKVKACQKLIQQQKFAEAIRTERSVPAWETADPLTIPVESSYKGPVYDPSNLNPTFLQDCMDYIKVPGNVIHKRYAYQIVIDVLKQLRGLTNMVDIELGPQEEITICGDIHGQYYDLMNIFKLNGMPSESNPYVFNGDFVDRGSFSIECIMALFIAKLIYPNHVHLTRGNHETRSMNRFYGFGGETTKKYDEKLYQIFSECFQYLPLAQLINKKVFIVHGGLFSKDGVTLKNIQELDRVCEPPEGGIMTEMMWSDPGPKPGRAPSQRGVACQFGPDVTESFLKENNLDLIIRSHEMKEEGYEMTHNGKLITVFSAPNYCDNCGNKGAFIRLNGKDLKPKVTAFRHVDHPKTPAMAYANPLLM